MVVKIKDYPVFDAKRKTLKEKSFKVYSAKKFIRFQRKWVCTETRDLFPLFFQCAICGLYPPKHQENETISTCSPLIIPILTVYVAVSIAKTVVGWCRVVVGLI